MTQPVKHAAGKALLVLAAFLMMTGSGFCRWYGDSEQPKPFVIKGVVSVQLEDNVDPSRWDQSAGKMRFQSASLNTVAEAYHITGAKKIFPWRTEKPPVNSGLRDLTRYFEFQFPDTVDVNTVVQALLKDPAVRNAEAVWAIPLDEFVANDPSVGSQWCVNKISLPYAWELETGSDSLKLGLIDSGVNYNHPDLTQNVWVNEGEDIDGDGEVYDEDDLNGIDDDGNGIVDDLIGYDFFTGLGTPVATGEDAGTPDTDPNDFDGHGTHCAGIAAAANNNLVGVTGVAGGWYGGVPAMSRGCRIMCLRAGAEAADGLGYVNSNNCASAMDYAVMMGANVISCSWGGSDALASALINALAQGVTVVHAAGNDNNSAADFLDVGVGGVVLSVAATRADDKKAWFSNYGTWVDVSAPGQSIYSTVSNEYVPSYATYDGTSMSAPMVAGLSLLIRSMMPSLNNQKADSILKNTTDDIDGINPSYAGMLGTGRINAYAALIGLANAKFSADVIQGNVPLDVHFTDLSPNGPTSWDWRFGDGATSALQDPSHTYVDPGVYTVSLLIDEPNGLGEEHLKHYIWAQADTLLMDSVEVYKGQQAVVPVYLNNTAVVKEIKFSFTTANSVGVKFDSVSIHGLRPDGLLNRSYTGYSSGSQNFEITLSRPTSGGGYLPPGNGPIMNIYLTAQSTAIPGGVALIDTLTWTSHTPGITTIWGDYWPEFTIGKVSIAASCCGAYTGGYTGNTDCDPDGKMALADITKLIDRVYLSKQPLCCEENGNVDGDSEGKMSLSDITKLIDHVYLSKQPTALCQ